VAEADLDERITVTDPVIARTMTSMLEGVVAEGTGVAAALTGRQVAGKTGTTEMPGTGGQGMKDNWFVGYTPQLVGAVWLGYDHTDASHYLTTTSKAAAAVFQKLMSEALKDEPVMTFPKMPGITTKPKNKEEKKKKNENTEKHGKHKPNKEDKNNQKGMRDDKEHRKGRGRE
jgi:penicillin-binding protein 2A